MMSWLYGQYLGSRLKLVREYISNLKRKHAENKFNFFTHKSRLSEMVIFLIVSINYMYSGCIYLPSASQNFTVMFCKKIHCLIWLECNLMVGNKMHLIFWGTSSNYKMTNHWQICCKNGETKMTESNFWFFNYRRADFGRGTIYEK